MNAACENTEPKWYGNETLSRKEEIALCFLFLPFALIIFFSPMAGVVTIPFIGCLMISIPQTRIHGILFVFSIIYVVVAVFLAHQKFYGLVAYGEVLNGILFFVLPYIPLFVPDIIPVFALMWGVVLTPLILIETLYWLWRSGKRWIQIFGIVLLASICIPAVQYTQQCRRNYEAIQAYQGQIMPVEELYALVGKPVYEAFHSGPMDLRPHFVYTDGDLIVPMTIDENDMATVHNKLCCFLSM